jgi:hypothetical protein
MVSIPQYRSHAYECDFASIRLPGIEETRIDFQAMPFKSKVDVKQFPGMFEHFKAKHLPAHELYLWKDSCCRDLTINALHYNLHNGFIEDILGNGIQDLKDGILRTADPLLAQNTLEASPSRILRIVRFAERFNFKID